MNDLATLIVLFLFFAALYWWIDVSIIQPRTSPQTITPRKIAMVLSCMDYRFIDQAARLLQELEHARAYDKFILAGASLGYNLPGERLG
jgi:hypothetical protein